MVIKKWRMTCDCCGKSWETKDDARVVCPACNTKLRFGFRVEDVSRVIEQDDSKRESIIQEIINYADRHNYEIMYYPAGTAEMGYNDLPMLTGNWNPNTMSKIYDYLRRWEDEYINLHWSDEWVACYYCGKAIKVTPDSYGWEPSYVSLVDGYEVCHECMKDNPDDLVECYKNTTDGAIPSWAIELIEKEGFTCLEDMDMACRKFETGWHPHQTDDPKEVIKELEETFEVESLEEMFDWIFCITSRGQFDINWTVYLRKV